jgi:hypothetical protein
MASHRKMGLSLQCYWHDYNIFVYHRSSSSCRSCGVSELWKCNIIYANNFLASVCLSAAKAPSMAWPLDSLKWRTDTSAWWGGTENLRCGQEVGDMVTRTRASHLDRNHYCNLVSNTAYRLRVATWTKLCKWQAKQSALSMSDAD